MRKNLNPDELYLAMPPTAREIVDRVSEDTKVSYRAIINTSCREINTVKARRKVIEALCQVQSVRHPGRLRYSYSTIGRMFGSDNTLVYQGVKREAKRKHTPDGRLRKNASEAEDAA